MPDNPEVDFSPDLLEVIRCPITKSDLKPADQEVIARLNDQIKTRELLNQIGQVVEAPIEAGFVNQDGSLLLPVRGGIVILIADQAIPLDQKV